GTSRIGRAGAERAGMAERALRLLLIPRESFPTDRVRINVLFGRDFVSRGHRIDLVMQAADESVEAGPRGWQGCTVRVGRTDTGAGVLHRLRKVWLDVAHDLGCL